MKKRLAARAEKSAPLSLGTAQIKKITARLASAQLLDLPWQQTRDPYEFLQGVRLLGRTPSRCSRDIASSPLGIGYETLDRCTFDPEWTYKLIGQAGVKWARCQTGWLRCEKEKGKYDFGWLDAVVDGLRKEGIETWFSLSFGNPLYTPCQQFADALKKAEKNGEIAPGWARGYVGETPYYNGKAAMDAWKKYVTALARHFKGRVRVFEIWNEPEWFWRHNGKIMGRENGSKKTAGEFADFLRITAQTVRKVIPQAQISFNLCELSSDWLPVLAEAGIAEFIDIYNHHSYEQYPEAGLPALYGQVRALFKRRDGKPFRIWQGENGRATDKANNGLTLPTAYSQARFIARRVITDIAAGAEVSSIFTVTDFLRYYEDGRDQYYGVLDGKTHAPKHGWYTLQALGWLCDGLKPAPENFVHFSPSGWHDFTDMIPFANVRTAAFTRRGVPVLAVWQAQHVELNAVPLCGKIQYVLGSSSLYKGFSHPVLIDPVRCRVWDISGLCRHDDDGIRAEVNAFYARDYPLFVTDLAIFDE